MDVGIVGFGIRYEMRMDWVFGHVAIIGGGYEGGGNELLCRRYRVAENGVGVLVNVNVVALRVGIEGEY